MLFDANNMHNQLNKKKWQKHTTKISDRVANKGKPTHSRNRNNKTTRAINSNRSKNQVKPQTSVLINPNACNHKPKRKSHHQAINYCHMSPFNPFWKYNTPKRFYTIKYITNYQISLWVQKHTAKSNKFTIPSTFFIFLLTQQHNFVIITKHFE